MDVTLKELESAIDGPRSTLDPDMAFIDPDPVAWVEYLEGENQRLADELHATHTRLRTIMTACFSG